MDTSCECKVPCYKHLMLAVSIKNLSHKINNKSVLNNVNFELKKDSIACILGPSGSGKTTLLKLQSFSWIFCYPT